MRDDPCNLDTANDLRRAHAKTLNILGIEKLTDEKWLNLFAARYRHGDHEGRWVFASRKAEPHNGAFTADAVTIVPILLTPGEPNRLVIEREFRVPVGACVLGFPAGLLEPGESMEDTVRREMREETGMEVVKIKRVTPPLYSSGGMTDETNALAFVDVRATPEMKPRREASEDIEVLLLDHAAVCRLCDDPTARVDLKAWTVLYLYRLLGKLE